VLQGQFFQNRTFVKLAQILCKLYYVNRLAGVTSAQRKWGLFIHEFLCKYRPLSRNATRPEGPSLPAEYFQQAEKMPVNILTCRAFGCRASLFGKGGTARLQVNRTFDPFALKLASELVRYRDIAVYRMVRG